MEEILKLRLWFRKFQITSKVHKCFHGDQGSVKKSFDTRTFREIRSEKNECGTYKIQDVTKYDNSIFTQRADFIIVYQSLLRELISSSSHLHTEIFSRD
mmetsp:Transcript_36588/g.114226  ORF Transcript_36588/g.114226 Transcript_36588/m.114226 type:complete len:99 (+) Transcript_36588:533-829(+)